MLYGPSICDNCVHHMDAHYRNSENCLKSNCTCPKFTKETQLMKDPEIVKVTVIVESEKAITTLSVPRSSEPDWNSTYSEPEPDWRNNRFTEPELIGLTMDLQPFKDETGVTHTITAVNKEVPGAPTDSEKIAKIKELLKEFTDYDEDISSEEFSIFDHIFLDFEFWGKFVDILNAKEVVDGS